MTQCFKLIGQQMRTTLLQQPNEQQDSCFAECHCQEHICRNLEVYIRSEDKALIPLCGSRLAICHHARPLILPHSPFKEISLALHNEDLVRVGPKILSTCTSCRPFETAGCNRARVASKMIHTERQMQSSTSSHMVLPLKGV